MIRVSKLQTKFKPKIRLFSIGDKPETVKGQLELRNVEFAYPERPTITVFKSFDLLIEQGKTVALAGQSGSGKSSIVALVLRFYDPLNGSVSLFNFLKSFQIC